MSTEPNNTLKLQLLAISEAFREYPQAILTREEVADTIEKLALKIAGNVEGK